LPLPASYVTQAGAAIACGAFTFEPQIKLTNFRASTSGAGFSASCIWSNTTIGATPRLSSKSGLEPHTI